MARGKHAKRKQNRDSNTLDADIARLKAEVAEARSRLTSAERAAAERNALEAKLAVVLRDRDKAGADERTRLTAHIEVLQTVMRKTHDVNTRVNTAWYSYVDSFIEGE